MAQVYAQKGIYSEALLEAEKARDLSEILAHHGIGEEMNIVPAGAVRSLNAVV